MKKLILLTAVLLFKAAGFTQEPPKVELFGGYSPLHIDTQGITGHSPDAICNL